MKKTLVLGFFLLFFTFNANAIDLGVGAKAGINGIGLDLSIGLTKNLNLRLSGTELDIEGEEETVSVGNDVEGDIDAELDFDYGANAVFLDWHVFGGGFRFTAGMFKNNGSADLAGTLQSTVVNDGQTLDPTDLVNQSIGGSVGLGDSYQPYLGIGWGRGAGNGAGLSFMVDVGVAVVEPEVSFEATLSASGAGNFPGGQAQLDQYLSDLESDAESDLDDLELWPVLSLGLNYRF